MSERGWNVYPRGTRWVVTYRAAPGDWRDHRIPHEAEVRTQRQAEAYAARRVPELFAGVAAKSSGTQAGPTVRALVDPWLELLRARIQAGKIRRSTFRAHQTNLEAVVDMLGDEHAARITPARARQWVRDLITREPRRRDGATNKSTPLRGKRISSQTVRNIFGTLRGMLDDAIADELVPMTANPLRNDAVSRELPPPSREADVVVHIPLPSVERLLRCEAVDEFWRTAYAVGVLTGMREDEIGALLWQDVDFDAEVPHVRVDKTLDMHQGQLLVTPPKTRAGNRLIPLHPALVRVLRGWRAAGWVRWVGHDPRPGDPLLPREDGTPRQLHNAAARLRDDLGRAGLPTTYRDRNITFHAFRRTFATALLEQGVEERVRKRLMGQSGGDAHGHYTALELRTILGPAIAKIPLSLSSGEVVQLPVRAVGA